MSQKKSYAERLKKMRESVQENKDLLKKQFPDDVTNTGNPDLIRKKDEIDSENTKEESDNE